MLTSLLLWKWFVFPGQTPHVVNSQVPPGHAWLAGKSRTRGCGHGWLGFRSSAAEVRLSTLIKPDSSVSCGLLLGHTARCHLRGFKVTIDDRACVAYSEKISHTHSKFKLLSTIQIMWDTLAECNASTINRFSHGNKTFFGPNSTFLHSPMECCL